MRWRSKQAVSVPSERKIEQFAHRSRPLVGSRRNQGAELADGKRSGKTTVIREGSAVTDELRSRDLRKMPQPERKKTHGGGETDR